MTKSGEQFGDQVRKTIQGPSRVNDTVTESGEQFGSTIQVYELGPKYFVRMLLVQKIGKFCLFFLNRIWVYQL